MYLFLEREEGGEKRGRETSTREGCCLSLPIRDLAYNPDMCPNRDSNSWIFGCTGRRSIH